MSFQEHVILVAHFSWNGYKNPKIQWNIPYPSNCTRSFHFWTRTCFPSCFDIGNRVWLLQQHIKTIRPCAKLDYQRLGPFSINDKMNDVTFCLDLPSQLRIHPLFHSTLLEPYQTSSIPNCTTPPQPPIELEPDLSTKLLSSSIPS